MLLSFLLFIALIYKQVALSLSALATFVYQLAFLFLVTTLVLTSASADETGNNKPFTAAPLKFNHLSTAEGLAQSHVSSITQDDEGFIWVATQDGLDRYDGNVFIHYRHKTNDKKSLANNNVRKVFLDNENIIWVATENGLSKYNKALDNFDNFAYTPNNINSLRDNKIWDIYQDNFNKIWVATSQGLHIYDPLNNHFNQISIQDFEDNFKEVITIFQDKNNNYWMGTHQKGIFIINDKLSYAFSLQEKNKWDINIPAVSLNDIKIIEGDYWLATDNGVFIVSDSYKITKHLPKKNKVIGLLSNKISAIEQTGDDKVWLAGENGLNRVNLLDYSIEEFQKNAYPSSLSENWLNDIYKDSSGRLWLGTYSNGLNIYNPSPQVFHHTYKNNFTVESFAETNSGSIWLSTQQDRLYKFTNNIITEEFIPQINTGILQLFSNNSNLLWIITNDNELYSYDNKLEITIQYPEWFKSVNTKENSSYTLADNKIWFVDSKGSLQSFDLESKELKNYPINPTIFTSLTFDKSTDSQILLATESTINPTIFTSLTVDPSTKSQLLLVTESNQIFQFDIKKDNYINISPEKIKHFGNKEIRNITASLNWIWLGSHSDGILLINRINNDVTYYNDNNLLNNNFIADILIDKNENAWVVTKRGISVITPSSGKVKIFTEDFLISDHDFLSFPTLLTSDKTMLFAGSNGFYHFDPMAAFQISQQIYKPIFINIYIANKKIAVIDNKSINKSTLNQQVNYLDEVIVDYNQSPLSIEFIAPNSKLLSQVRYKYRLLGSNEQWIEADPSYLRATYTNLTPGDYNFEVQVYDLYNPELIKSNNIKIHIMSPWWFSKSILLIYALIILILLIYITQKMYRKSQYHQQIQKSEERLKLSLWGSGDEMWDWNINTGRIFQSNVSGALELPQDGAHSKDEYKTQLHQSDIPRVKKALDDHFEGKTEFFEVTYRLKDNNNKWIWVLERGKIVARDENDKPTRMTGTLKDISKIKETEERLKIYAKCFENISDGLIIFNEKFIAVDINEAYQRITGITKDKILGKPLQFKQYPEILCEKIKDQLINNGCWQGEIKSVRENGDLYLIDLNINVIRDENRKISHFFGVFSDITKRKRTEQKLRTQANNDKLTGLPNRSYFQKYQVKLVENKIQHAILVFGLDNFKKINDSLGHQLGDVLLCQVTQRLLKIVSRQDSIYRLGGDEFSIIIENTDNIYAITSLVKKILITIAQPLKLRSKEIVLTGSIGIVIYPEDEVLPHKLLKNAYTAMYYGKNLGGNTYQFFNESMNKKAVKRLQIESLILRGLKDDLFSVYYQPKIETATGKVSGIEALVRYITPNKSLIRPIAFIPTAEETGQIIDIGEVVLRKSCFATKKWVDAGLFGGRIAVNLSALQFYQPNLVDVIASILIETNLPAKYLELEITEDTVMESPQIAIDIMLKIRRMGIYLSLDDFGTGYSSLVHLKKFPFNTLKIDKAFIDDIEYCEQGREMVETIISIGHNLDMLVIAEGVETSKQLSILLGLKCEQIQGYLYSKPLNEQDMNNFLFTHQITDKSTSFINR